MVLANANRDPSLRAVFQEEEIAKEWRGADAEGALTEGGPEIDRVSQGFLGSIGTRTPAYSSSGTGGNANCTAIWPCSIRRRAIS